MSYIRKIVSLIAATVLAVGLVGVAQTAAQAAGAATFTVNDGTNAIEGAFVSVVTKDAAGIDTDGDSTADVTSGGTVAGGTTDENGQFVAKLEDGTDLPDGNYAYSVAKPGFGVKVGGFTITGSALSVPTISMTANANKLEFVNAHGAQVTGIVADAQSCVFYATTSSIPSLYRTTDCAGNWAPVVLNRDEKAESTGNDGFEGMDNTQSANFVTTSGYPGEVAAKVGGKIWFSRDFGTTWNSFNAPNGNMDGLHWAHALDTTQTPAVHTSFMLITTGDNTNATIQVMPTGENGTIADSTPTEDPAVLSATATGFKATAPATSLIRLLAADSAVHVFRSNQSGVKKWTIPSGANASAIASALGGNPTSDLSSLTRTDTASYTDLLIVGKNTNAHSPDIFVYDREPSGATIKAASSEFGSSSYAYSSGMYGATNNGSPSSLSAITGQMGGSAPSCGENNTPPVGSVAPILPADSAISEWSGINSMAMIRSCLVLFTTTGANIRGTSIPAGKVVVLDVSGANNNTGSAFDAGFDLVNNSVVLSGDGARGIVKAASFKETASGGPVSSVKNLGTNFGYVPLFPTPAHVLNNYLYNRADAGLAATSGGFAVQGMTSPTVRDVATSPLDPAASIVGMSFTGGGRTIMSVDSGASYFTVGGGGSNAVTWWVDQDENQWIAGGSSGNANTFMSAGQFTNAQYAQVVADVAAGNDIDSTTYSGTRLALGMPLAEGDMTTGFGSKSFGLGDMQGELTSVVGIMGTRKVLVAGSQGDDKSTLAIANLTGTGTNVSLASVAYLNSAGSFVADSTFTNRILTTPSFTGARITSVQYCPTGSAALVADKAFIALADESNTGTGGLRVISNVSTAPVLSTPTGIALGTSDNVRDLKVECDTGTVVAISRGADGQGGQPQSSGPTIWFSLDGGVAFDKLQNTTPGLPAQTSNVETVALEADPVSGEVKIGLVSGQGDVVAVTFDADAILDDVGLTMDMIADPTLPVGVDATDFASIGNTDVALTEINDSQDAEGFAFGGEKPGDFEFAADENELDDLGQLARSLGRYRTLRGIAGVASVQPDPLLGSGAGALTADVSGSGSAGGGSSAPTINVTAAGSPWANGVSKPMKYNEMLTVSATSSNASQVSIATQNGCTFGGGKITATAGAGSCTVSFTVGSTTVTRTINLAMATPVKPAIAAPKIKKSVTLLASGRVGAKSYRYTYSLKSGSSKYCTLSGTKLTGKKKGSCVVYVTSTGAPGFVAPLAKQTITLAIK